MGRPPKDKDCIRIDICINGGLNEKIKMYQAEQFLKGIKMKKFEANEDYIEMLYQFFIENAK